MPARRKTINPDAEQDGIGKHLLSLSLFIMLLAFFIVLTSISSYEQTKAGPVVNRINAVFSTDLSIENGPQPSIESSPQGATGRGDTFERLSGLFSSKVIAAETATNRQRGIIVARVSRADFESAITELGGRRASSDFSKRFMPLLVSVLRSDSGSRPYRMEIVYFVDQNPAILQNEQPQKMVDTINAVSRSAAALEFSGLSAHLMTVGIRKGAPDMVELYFQPAEKMTGGRNG